jgi:hypothetical protein
MDDPRGNNVREYWEFDAPENSEINIVVHEEFTLRQFLIFDEFLFDIYKIP